MTLNALSDERIHSSGLVSTNHAKLIKKKVRMAIPVLIRAISWLPQVTEDFDCGEGRFRLDVGYFCGFSDVSSLISGNYPLPAPASELQWCALEMSINYQTKHRDTKLLAFMSCGTS